MKPSKQSNTRQSNRTGDRNQNRIARRFGSGDTEVSGEVIAVRVPVKHQSIFGGTSVLDDELLRSVISGRLRL